jgi:hypothetical protein
MGGLLIITIMLGITIGGLALLASGAFPKILTFAKSTLEKTAKGAVLALCGWLLVNSVMNVIGYKHPQGGKWYQHDCSGGTDNNNNNNNNGGGKCDPKNKKLESLKIQCDEKNFKLEGDGTGFYVVLDTLSEDGKGKTKKLKATAKYDCDGETSEEDVTEKAEWKASDETQVKADKGVVQAIAENINSENIPYVEAKLEEKSSNQAKVYINACPNTQTAETGSGGNSAFALEKFEISKANAQSNWTCPNCNTPSDPGNSTCKSCGQNSTCRFIYGNENATKKFILIRGWQRCLRELNTPENTVFGGNPCKNAEWWDKNSQADYKKFKETVDLMKTDIDYAPNGKQEFAVYMSDLVADKDSSCPPKKDFEMYGYVCKGNQGRDYQWQGYAAFCIGDYKKGIMAHELIGHGFAWLDDEYTEAGKTFNPGWPHFNCTASSKIPTKWGTSITWEGCSLEQRFFRPSYDSIMSASYFSLLAGSQGFQSVNEEIINMTYQDPDRNDPNGPLKYYEPFY